MSLMKEKNLDENIVQSIDETMDILNFSLHSLDITKDDVQLSDTKEAISNDSNREKIRGRQTKPESSSRSPRIGRPNGLRTISLDEVAWHDTADDCWLSIYDFVYDCTDFVHSHPGGSDVLMEYAGRDATVAFIGTGHSNAALRILDSYLIGELPPEERIFRVPGGVKVADFLNES